MSDPETSDTIHEAIEAKLPDYVEGTLGEAEAREVERHLETCDACRESAEAAKESLRALSGLKKQPAPAHFNRDVAETIRRRSRGRFFGRRTLGDRVPLELLALLVLALGLGLYFLLRRSESGSLQPFDHGRERPVIHEGADDVVPRPQPSPRQVAGQRTTTIRQGATMRTTIISILGLLALAGGVSCKKDKEAATSKKEEPAQKPSEPTTPTSTLLAVGADVPVVDTVAHDGTPLKTSALGGAPTVIYFYPKDETGGCNAEAEAFRDAYPEIQKMGVKLFGVSLDDVEAHKGFAANHKLPFPLIADAGGAIAKQFGVSVEGGYADRVTFVVGPDGKIAKVFPDVNPTGHADEVLAALKALPGGAPATPAGGDAPAPAPPRTEPG